MTIYAHWTKAVTVTFEPNGGRMWGVRERSSRRFLAGA